MSLPSLVNVWTRDTVRVRSMPTPLRVPEIIGIDNLRAESGRAMDPAAPPGQKRLAIVLRSLGGGGGAERAMANLAGALAGRGHRVDLVLRRVAGHFLKEVPATVRIVDLQARLPALAPVPIARYLRRARPDAMLVTGLYTNLAAILGLRLAGTGTRTVISVQNHLSVQVAGSSGPWKKLVPAASRHLFARADRIVAVSHGVADDLSRFVGVPAGKLTTIHNPLVSSRIAERRAEAPAHPWLIDDGPAVVLGMGKLRPQKDFATLIRAFALVRQRRPARLLIGGDGPERAALLRLARRLGVADDVDLPGFFDNPFACMAHAAAFVLSSAWEGLPSVLVEAMACGCPVVSTDCPSGPAEILEHGRYGPLVAVGDHAALAEAIAKVLEQPPDPEGLISRASAFSEAASAQAYEAVLLPTPP
jgi:glycosyltransferase involved in cell wall biosynthesis